MPHVSSVHRFWSSPDAALVQPVAMSEALLSAKSVASVPVVASVPPESAASEPSLESSASWVSAPFTPPLLISNWLKMSWARSRPAASMSPSATPSKSTVLLPPPQTGRDRVRKDSPMDLTFLSNRCDDQRHQCVCSLDVKPVTRIRQHVQMCFAVVDGGKPREHVRRPAVGSLRADDVDPHARRR